MPRLLPLLRWPGGQFKLARKIEATFPDHETYVEPFAGGASLFWTKARAEREALGDKADWMVRFLDKVRRGEADRCQPVKQSEATFKLLRKRHKAGDACATLLLNKMTFDGAMRHRAPGYDGKVIGRSHVRNLSRYARRLRKTHLTTGDFADTMRAWDSPRTLHYLDPPWSEAALSRAYAKDKYGEHGELSLDHVAKVAMAMKGRVAISYQDDPRVREILGRHKFYLYRIPITMGGTHCDEGRGRRKTYRILATTWKLPHKLKYRR